MTGVAQEIERLMTETMGVALPVGLKGWDGSHAGPVDGPQAVLRSPKALRRLLFKPGELGLARAYVCGDLDVEGDLTEALRRGGAAVRDAGTSGISAKTLLSGLGFGLRRGVLGPPPAPPAEEARLRGRFRDRAAISHHYDHGNDFYALVLDEHMAYSCAYFTADDPDYMLDDAQRDKLDLICEKLGLQEGMRLLDVGCGWGSLLLRAAEKYEVRAVGITLSAEQAEFVHARAKQRGLDHLVEVRLRDYRELPDTEDAGSFDAVASIEMGEHVGEDNYPRYTETLRTMLRPQGRLLLQQMSRGTNAPGGGAFIESYIAPDMTMRPLSATMAHLERAGLEIRDVQALREHYVQTVRAWQDTLEQRWDAVVAHSGERFARVWRLYLAGGALAFEENRMGVDQILAVRLDGEGRSGFGVGA
ncbi:cyclopropane-fatty-acyl-phospholipid synthase family protein [Haloechinothrix salitolerans]|uniref:Class I SAM-dependent methyltransferase n=1 Tax=Haloechinothrix salitolerans TaxID=926830 RepID=A0ABW2C3R7_9PSEU